jgi:hypothetical protein
LFVNLLFVNLWYSDKITKHQLRGQYLIKFATIRFACTVLFFASLVSATLAHSQEKIDIAVGGGTLFSTATKGPSLAYVPIPERSGTYPSLSFNAILKKHYGFNVEGSWRDKKADYYNYEKYRPIFVDANGLYQIHVRRKTGIDLLAGIGVDRTEFYLPLMTSCASPSGTCYTSGTHFMEHLGFEVHYYFWRHFFVRPEAHYYHVQNNQGFNSDNVLRVGASVGWTIGPRD